MKVLDGTAKGLLKLKKKYIDNVEERAGHGEIKKKIGEGGEELILGCDVSSDVDKKELNLKSCELKLKDTQGNVVIDPNLIPLLQLPNQSNTSKNGITAGTIQFKSDKPKEPEVEPKSRIEKFQKTAYDRVFHRQGRGKLTTTIANALQLDITCDGSHDKINRTAELDDCTVSFKRIGSVLPPAPAKAPEPVPAPQPVQEKIDKSQEIPAEPEIADVDAEIFDDAENLDDYDQ